MYTASSVYGISQDIPGGTTGNLPGYRPTSGMGMTFDDAKGLRAVIDVRNPLFVFGCLLAATLGAIGVSGSARVGPAKVAAELGKA